MFAGVPCYNLEKLYKEIADQMPEPRTLAGAWKEMRDTWARQQESPDYFFDTPVPPIAVGQKVRTDSALESSIGDLAPRGLQ